MSIKPYLCRVCNTEDPNDFYIYVDKNNREFKTKSICTTCIKVEKKEYKRNNNLIAKYGITSNQYLELLKSQDYMCKCCRDPWNSPRRNWPVDHDWKCCPSNATCGECIRGIICMDCNIMLGHAKDEGYRLNAGIRYLSEWEVR